MRSSLSFVVVDRAGRAGFTVVSSLAFAFALTSGCGRSGAGIGPVDASAQADLLAPGCAQDSECAAPTPRCDTSSRTCVACRGASDCPLGMLCDPATRACAAGCSAEHGCGDAGVCETDGGLCVGCLGDGDCGDPSRPRCDTATRSCVPCLPANDNCPLGTYCAETAGHYACAGGCKASSDCATVDGGTANGNGDGGSVDGGALAGPRCDPATHACVACLADSDCPLGAVCHGDACVAGCTLAHGCANGASCCGGACSDTTTDAANCGACGTACKAADRCCSSSCVSPASDVANCGGCHLACALANAMPACMGGSCQIAACQSGHADCDLSPANGCETNTESDPGNCGGCSLACALPHATPTCMNGGCAVAACNTGYADCDHMPANGCETDTETDAGNCGGCSLACALPHATPICMNGGCAVAACDTGYADCDHLPANGCETNLESDSANCGGCGIACGQAMSCSGGVCVGGCAGQVVNDANTLCVPAGQTLTLSGDHCWAVSATVNGTLVVAPSTGANATGTLTVRSPFILVGASGSISADAAGSAGGLPATTNGGHVGMGASPGCGGGPGQCVGQGGSGAGYGGAGGTPDTMTQFASPCDACDNATIAHCYGTPGPAVGTSSDVDWAMGSGGGAAGNSCGCTSTGGRGGAGGGAVVLLGGTVRIDGTLSAAGEKPPVDPSTMCGYRPGGGGGAGGAILVRAQSLAGAGTMRANGGAGGDAVGQTNDWGWAGGGGGGGRVKVFASTSTFTGATSAAAGGPGISTCTGTYCYSGVRGSDGTTFTSATIPAAFATIACGGL